MVWFNYEDSLINVKRRRYTQGARAEASTRQAARANRIDTEALVNNLLGLLYAHVREHAAATPLVEARMDERTRRTTFRHMLRKRIAAILRMHSPTLSPEAVREMAVVLVSLMKAECALADEVSLPGRAAAVRDLRTIAVRYIEERLTPGSLRAPA